MQKKKPKFVRQNSHRKVRVKGKSWRRPRGLDSKQKRGKKHMPKRPRIGYGTGGKKEKDTFVGNVNELEGLEKETKVIIRSTVGKKKRIDIIEKAKKMKIKIMNE